MPFASDPTEVGAAQPRCGWDYLQNSEGKMDCKRRVLINLFISLFAIAASAQTWDAVKDFSSSNPSNNWEYGHGQTGTNFAIYGSFSSSCPAFSGFSGVECWWTGGQSLPAVGLNYTSGTLCYNSSSTVVLPTNALWMHPGSSLNDDSIVKWTAPTSGTYSISGFFEGLDSIDQTGVYVSVYRNTTPIFGPVFYQQAASCPNPGPSLNIPTQTLSLAAGDVISFAVNNGGNYIYDSTGFEASISVVACVLPPNATMVAWYPFDEQSPVTMSANLASGNVGVQHNGPLGFTPGEVAGAAHFNGTNQYVESPSTIMTNFGTAGSFTTCKGPSGSDKGSRSTCLGNFSIDTWIRTTGPTSEMAIVDKRVGSPPSMLGYYFFVSGGMLGLEMADRGSGTGFTDYMSPVLTPSIYDGNWHHVAVTVNRIFSSPPGIQWYHNGAVVGVGSDPTDRKGSLVNSSPLRVGTRTANSPLTGWFKGDLDELEIYNRALGLPEVQAIFNAGPAGKCK
jgi:hypothetical protein